MGRVSGDEEQKIEGEALVGKKSASQLRDIVAY